MTGLILSCMLACGGCDETPNAVPLADVLKNDLAELLKDDRHAVQVRAAGRILQKEYPAEAFTILRRIRSRAAVPLLLLDMLERKPTPAHLTTLTILTGEDADLWFGDNKKVEAGIRDWWLKRKDSIVCDPAKMSAEQLEIVVGEFLRSNEYDLKYSTSGNNLRYQIDARLYMLFSSYDKARWPAEDELHPAMVRAILRTFGWHEQGAGPRDAHAFGYAAVPLLSMLRKNGQAPQLEKIAADEKQNSAVRLICSLAIGHADEEMNVKQLLTLYARENRQERRLIALLALQYADSIAEARDFLLESLDDKNELIRDAVLHVLKAKPLPAALPRLQTLLKTGKDTELIIYAIGGMNTRESKQTLADYVDQGVNTLKPYDLYIALYVLQTSLDRSFISAGSYSNPTYLREKANEAVRWWREQREQK